MKKYLFLDIDGVMNNAEWAEKRHNEGSTRHMLEEFDREAVVRLQRIVDATGCEIVVSSTWRILHTVSKIRKMLVQHGLSMDVKFLGATPRLHCERGHEIQAWMDAAGVTPEQIVILDDDSDMVHLLPRHVKTSFMDGLQDRHVEMAIAMLNDPAKVYYCQSCNKHFPNDGEIVKTDAQGTYHEAWKMVPGQSDLDTLRHEVSPAASLDQPWYVAESTGGTILYGKGS